MAPVLDGGQGVALLAREDLEEVVEKERGVCGPASGLAASLVPGGKGSPDCAGIAGISTTTLSSWIIGHV